MTEATHKRQPIKDSFGWQMVEVFLYMSIGFTVMWGFQLFTDLRTSNNIKKVGYVKLSIVGETNITSVRPFDLAETILKEANTIWSQSSVGWFTEINSTSLTVESHSVTVGEKPSPLPIQRAWTVVNCASARSLYDFLMSPEGFAVIDPSSRKEDFSAKPLATFNYRKGALKVQRTVSQLARPLLSSRDFVVLNVLDNSGMTFASKSVIYPVPPPLQKTKTVRAFNSFALKVSNAQKGTCKVQFVNIILDLIPYNGFAHFINAKLYFPGLIKRLAAATNQTTTAAGKK